MLQETSGFQKHIYEGGQNKLKADKCKQLLKMLQETEVGQEVVKFVHFTGKTEMLIIVETVKYKVQKLSQSSVQDQYRFVCACGAKELVLASSTSLCQHQTSRNIFDSKNGHQHCLEIPCKI
jgi:hypothetical protein